MTRIVVAVGLLGIMAFVVFACVSAAVPRLNVTIQKSGFDENRFYMLLFPAGQDCIVQRAVIASLAEYKRPFVEVHVEGIVKAVPARQLTPVPPRDCTLQIERLNQQLATWGEATDWSHIGYVFIPAQPGNTAAVTVRDKKGTTFTYSYIVEGSTVCPCEIRIDVDLPKKMSQ